VSYWQYWNLNAAPLTSGGSNHFFRGQSVEEALARIEFVCGQRRKLATLLAPAGVGKTCLLNYLVTNPPRDAERPLPRVIAISMLGLSGGELAHELASRLSGNRVGSASEAWSSLTDYFSTSVRSASQTLLLVDDVESSSPEAENDLVRIVRAADDAHVSVVLAIEAQLASTVSRWLMERSYLQIELPAWDIQQTASFLEFCFSKCGRSDSMFTDAAVARLHELSRGTARRIVQLADLALIAGAVTRATCVDDSLIAQVAHELPKSLSTAA
jgi:general secretion pathway protein A